MKTHIELYNSSKMPIIGYGMWQCENAEELEAALDYALDAGYRHFDTAYEYSNEAIFGKVLKKWFESGKVKREDLFIVTKLPIQGVHHDRVEKFLNIELKDLQLDYVDLYLVHNPATLKTTENGTDVAFGDDGNVILDLTTTLEQVWKAMEAQVYAGRTKSIGISNFNISQVERIVKSANILPANHQIEVNVSYPNRYLREVCTKHGITVCGYAPLGSPGRPSYYEPNIPKDALLQVQLKIQNLLKDPVVVEISKKYSKTSAQILLRFLTQQDIIVIPKSISEARIKENIDIFNFELGTDDMGRLDSLAVNDEGGWGIDWISFYPGLEKHPEFTLV